MKIIVIGFVREIQREKFEIWFQVGQENDIIIIIIICKNIQTNILYSQNFVEQK